MSSHSGYPHFMQNNSNPMQSGFHWSSFGNSMPNMTQDMQTLENQLKEFRKLSAGSMDKQNSTINIDNGYYTNPVGPQACNQISGPEPNTQLLKIKELLGSLSQNLGMMLPTGAVDERQVLPGNISQQIGMGPNAPDVGQILQKICPGINALQYCHEYCQKKKFEYEYVSALDEGKSNAPPFTVVMNIRTYKDGPRMQTCATDRSKREAKQKAAEQMIPTLLKLFGPMPKSDVVSNPARRSAKPKKAPIISDREWMENVANLGPTSILYEWAQRKGLPLPTYEYLEPEIIDNSDQHIEVTHNAKKQKLMESQSKMFTVCCLFEGKSFTGVDMNKKKAKVLASIAAGREFVPKYEEMSPKLSIESFSTKK